MANTKSDRKENESGKKNDKKETSKSEQGNTANRGFASMDPKQQHEIASEGGKAAHASGHAHEFDSKEAKEAGKKGGEAVSRDREHMADIGKKGGESRADGKEEEKSKSDGNRSGK